MTTDLDSLVVSEVFGPTVQGEGPSAGQRASFIRLGGCNLHCSWCDTPYTWDASRFSLRAELTRQPVEKIAATVLGMAADLAVISGGEPLLHQSQPGWLKLLERLGMAGRLIEVETNGTQAPTPETAEWVTRFNVSPKLQSAGDPESVRLVPTAIRALLDTGNAVFKFVCDSPAAVGEAATTAARLGIPPHLVWIMPEGTKPETLNERLHAIATPAVEAGFNLTTRLHVHAWGTERGR